jgi:hypothetical protein
MFVDFKAKTISFSMAPLSDSFRFGIFAGAATDTRKSGTIALLESRTQAP